jgi:hypothetical protein
MYAIARHRILIETGQWRTGYHWFPVRPPRETSMFSMMRANMSVIIRLMLSLNHQFLNDLPEHLYTVHCA